MMPCLATVDPFSARRLHHTTGVRRLSQTDGLAVDRAIISVMRVIVVGGGIGGLTTAIALHRVGIDADVYEQAETLREVGAGIGLASNALRALDALGLAVELQRGSITALQVGLRRPDGGVLVPVAVDDLSRGVGAVAVVHRAELLALLGRHVEPSRVHLGHRCVDVQEDANGVSARFDNGKTVRADAVIAADGLRSAVRAQLFGNPAPRYAGYTAWRSVVSTSIPESTMTETWGRGCRFGIVPMASGRVYWFATRNAPEGQRDPSMKTKATLAELFRGWHRPIEELIGASTEESILRNDIYDMDPLRRFVKGRVALLGDAAHPMTPNLGQGACQAIEDGVVLAALLKSVPRIEEALAEYERRRLDRTRKILLWSRWLGKIAQIENPVLCALRDFGMRMAPKQSGPRQMRALFGAEILRQEEQALLKR
jgi:2-polyprenyl-6-methoxyphenol hydroxylase-like FAD-dependent oxidoreductase